MNDPQNVQQGIWPKGTTIAAPDPSTVVITITDPQPAFVDNLLSQVGIYPKGSKPADLVTHPVSAGPFTCSPTGRRASAPSSSEIPISGTSPIPVSTSWISSSSATPRPRLSSFRPARSTSPRSFPDPVEALRQSPGVAVPVFPTLGEELIRLQRTKQPAFQDKNVRMAMNYAIDKNAIVNLVFFGTAAVEDSEMPRTKFYKAQTPYTFDLAKAKEFMAASAFPKGFKTSLLISSGEAVESGIATIVKDQLAAIGIDVAIQQVEAGTKFELRGKKDFEMFLATTSADQIDPQIFWYFCCAQGFNLGSAFTDYLSPDNQALFTKVQTEGDPAKRADLFAQMQKVVWDDAAQLYLVFLKAPHGLTLEHQGLCAAAVATSLPREGVQDTLTPTMRGIDARPIASDWAEEMMVGPEPAVGPRQG